jgi:hypothetical protein
MTIIIPMAGLSSRFTKAGYTLPKYMLYAVDRSLFNIAVSSFEKFFSNTRFVFVARDIFDTRRFIDSECKLLGIKSYDIVILEKPTQGQAETVLMGIRGAHLDANESILIFNIDTFRPGFSMPARYEFWDGYLEVFKGSGSNWSYARTETGDGSRVVETAEKKEISDNCSTGIYYFKTVSQFMDAYNWGIYHTQRNEVYVAPLYNYLISHGAEIHINVINRDEVIFCGVPEEYKQYLNQLIKYTRL